MASRLDGFQISDLPQTLADTVEITRHLGIRYLWIDRLCICQDDDDDWARESAHMAEIYSNAYLVIAANHANDVSVGCFRPTLPSRIIDLPEYASKIHVSLTYNGDELESNPSAFRFEPLSTRGWALQERLLSPRTLHYNKRQMYFECNHGIVGGNGYHREDRYGRLNVVQKKQQGVRNVWYSILQDYSMRNFTKATDRLPALGGIAKVFEKPSQGNYVAGLWSNALIEGLAWRIFSRAEKPNETYIGPSWSWVGYSGVPGEPHFRGNGTLTKVIDYDVKLKHSANPYGEVESAWIRIRGPITELVPQPNQDVGDDQRLITKKPTLWAPLLTHYREDDDKGQSVLLDYVSTKWSELDLKLLLLEGGTLRPELTSKTSNNDHLRYFGLVVASVNASEPTVVRRIGSLRLTRREIQAMVADETNRQIVTLV